ncbi:MAG: hypothetical protein K8I00_00960 [Candidatus Omnitrophica bacterium]|nr:hypothetical protein [Candidatus Omnitrophota bacterium]
MKNILSVTIVALILAYTVPASALFGLPAKIEGTIQSVSEESLAVHEVKGDTERILKIMLNTETDFQEASTVGHLQEGDRVKIKYREKDGSKIAVSVKKILEKDSAELKI